MIWRRISAMFTERHKGLLEQLNIEMEMDDHKARKGRVKRRRADYITYMATVPVRDDDVDRHGPDVEARPKACTLTVHHLTIPSLLQWKVRLTGWMITDAMLKISAVQPSVAGGWDD